MAVVGVGLLVRIADIQRVGGCLAFFASGLAPTQVGIQFRVLWWLVWRFRGQARSHRGFVC